MDRCDPANRCSRPEWCVSDSPDLPRQDFSGDALDRHIFSRLSLSASNISSAAISMRRFEKYNAHMLTTAERGCPHGRGRIRSMTGESVVATLSCRGLPCCGSGGGLKVLGCSGRLAPRVRVVPLSSGTGQGGRLCERSSQATEPVVLEQGPSMAQLVRGAPRARMAHDRMCGTSCVDRRGSGSES